MVQLPRIQINSTFTRFIIFGKFFKSKGKEKLGQLVKIMGPKKRKSDGQVEEISNELRTAEFLDLNDDCIEVIFDRCSLDTLCSLSLTCKRINKLAKFYFNRKYTKHRMEIIDELTGPTVNCNENYVKCFASKIRNIRIATRYLHLNQLRIFKFLKENCCENLKELELDTVALSYKRPEKYGSIIKDQLKSVETLSLINCSSYDIYKGFLRYCTQLKHLIVKEDLHKSFDYTWMNQKYPHLESLGFHLHRGISNKIDDQLEDNLESFIQLNPQIKNISTTELKLLMVINRSQLNLDYIILRICKYDLLSEMVELLQILCVSNQLRRVKLEFGFHMLFGQHEVDLCNTFGLFEQFVGLSFTAFNYDYLAGNLIRTGEFVHVKSLCLELSRLLEAEHFQRLPALVPNVETICIHPWSEKHTANFSHYVPTMIERLENLTAIAIRKIDPSIASSLLTVVDTRRKNAAEVRPLTIYLPSIVVQELEPNIRDRSSVRIESIVSYDVNIALFEKCCI